MKEMRKNKKIMIKKTRENIGNRREEKRQTRRKKKRRRGGKIGERERDRD